MSWYVLHVVAPLHGSWCYTRMEFVCLEVLEGHYNSTVGDRLKFKGTFRLRRKQRRKQRRKCGHCEIGRSYRHLQASAGCTRICWTCFSQLVSWCTVMRLRCGKMSFCVFLGFWWCAQRLTIVIWWTKRCKVQGEKLKLVAGMMWPYVGSSFLCKKSCADSSCNLSLAREYVAYDAASTYLEPQLYVEIRRVESHETIICIYTYIYCIICISYKTSPASVKRILMIRTHMESMDLRGSNIGIPFNLRNTSFTTVAKAGLGGIEWCINMHHVNHIFHWTVLQGCLQCTSKRSTLDPQMKSEDELYRN